MPMFTLNTVLHFMSKMVTRIIFIMTFVTIFASILPLTLVLALQASNSEWLYYVAADFCWTLFTTDKESVDTPVSGTRCLSSPISDDPTELTGMQIPVNTMEKSVQAPNFALNGPLSGNKSLSGFLTNQGSKFLLDPSADKLKILKKFFKFR